MKIANRLLMGEYIFFFSLICVLFASFFLHMKGLLLTGYAGTALSLFLAKSYMMKLWKIHKIHLLVLVFFLFFLLLSVFHSPNPFSSLNAFLWNYFFNVLLFLACILYFSFHHNLSVSFKIKYLFLPNVFFLASFIVLLTLSCSDNISCYFLKPMALAQEKFIGLVNLTEPLLFFLFLGFSSFFFFKRDNIRYIFCLISLLNLLLLVILGRRAALLGLTVSLSITLTILPFLKKINIYILCIFVILFSIVLLTPYKKQILIRSDKINILLSFCHKNFRNAGSLGQRLYSWPYYLKYLRHHPFRGTGLGRKVQKRVMRSYIEKHSLIGHAHNLFLNLAIQSGIQTSFVFLVFYFLILKRLSQFIKPSHNECYLIAGLMLFLIAFFIAALFEGLERGIKFLPFWLASGIGLGLITEKEIEKSYK